MKDRAQKKRKNYEEERKKWGITQGEKKIEEQNGTCRQMEELHF
jgi:hypothetical protein